jgi:DNA end-binding protein Ku
MVDAPEGGAEVIDLMEALRASLEKKKAPAPAKTAVPEERKAPKRAQQAEPAPRKAAKK